MIAETVNALFTTSTPGAVELSAGSTIGGIVTGTAVAFFSALIPAREAARVAPAEAMQREAREHHKRLNIRRDLTIAAIASLTAAILCRFGPIDGRPVLGYVATLFAVGAAALAAPAFVLAVVRLLRGTLKRVGGAAGLIAGRSLTASLSRTSIVVTALATAISMMVSVGVMVGSFRETVQVWLENQLRADIYMRAEGPSSAGIYPPIDPFVPEIIRNTPGAADVDVFRAFQFHYEGTKATFGAGITDIVRRQGSLRFLSGDADRILRSLPGHDRAIVSEPFANKHHLRAGDFVTLPLAGEQVRFRIVDMFYDYGSEKGFIVIDRSRALQYLPDPASSNLAIYVAPGSNIEQVRAEVERVAAGHNLVIFTNSSLRQQAIQIFDRTFAITYALEVVAVIVAVIGIAGAMLALVLDRRRELGLLRFLGAAVPQIRKLILVEAGLIGLLANVAGLALGVALSLLLIFVINKQSFGWTIRFHWPIAVLLGALSLVYVSTVLAGFYPAHVATSLNPIEVVHEE